MVITEFSSALNQVASERGISPDSVINSIKLALISAYRKDFPGVSADDIDPQVNPLTGEVKIMIKGMDATPSGFGRIAAQTAKQVILQKIRETEKQTIIEEYKKKIGQIVSGYIFRVDKNVVILDLGRAQGVMPTGEQVPTEVYLTNRKIKVLVKEIAEGPKGEEVIVSRSAPKFIEALFAQEVPEIMSGAVKIENIAREAGNRTKMAVSSSDERVDPVGACVGQKGVRVQAIVAELGDEKIDIIDYNEDISKFITASLSPAKVVSIKVDAKKRGSNVVVPENQLSLAIGKDGQNVRLAAKLTGWKIDIRGDGVDNEKKEEEDKEKEKKEKVAKEKIKSPKVKKIKKEKAAVSISKVLSKKSASPRQKGEGKER
ncbi:transcription termination/antitermination protein NusA [candidate division WWE3 bacterium CG09_land_8_20_14_0_10_39_24]|uniref:Transcription termination/antitermination protein NusA n=2 Tax=Katanobacteria TaxID=422282 RepID=A0A2G9XCJ6_UNCKA|nr:MAG: transcription termination factor NusA [bacterium CG09_39_24]PIP04689.1 MAG: transcription termination/antitermination protein NusA [candidate division WWE3 bacterium CG23_combo_of_CG06-09_8_20_14_all_40_14]PIS13088.1 MAG: transcription termination/antitermination protein NusA [candidate division WWE3 bacterium CG09_land_8_20_14_0_10_39_24]PJE50859.1 MAG: transcription termination/antitermination protein NusA [candidate division WWE3 bacterium CG10_big_fil_rev_8_21_14_0_10_39_14]